MNNFSSVVQGMGTLALSRFGFLVVGSPKSLRDLPKNMLTPFVKFEENVVTYWVVTFIATLVTFDCGLEIMMFIFIILVGFSL